MTLILLNFVSHFDCVVGDSSSSSPSLQVPRNAHTHNKTPLNWGTAAIPLLFLSHEKETTHFTPL